jgi:anti-sigma factor RsiW
VALATGSAVARGTAGLNVGGAVVAVAIKVGLGARVAVGGVAVGIVASGALGVHAASGQTKAKNTAIRGQLSIVSSQFRLC